MSVLKDKSLFTAGTPGGSGLIGVVNPVDSVTDGNMALVAMDASRNLKVNVVAGGAGGGAVTIADGADVAEGATADAAVVGDVSGTVSAKLRGMSKILNSVWSSGNNWLQVSIQNATLAVTQSGAWVLSAGAAIIGKVGIDQTTPGTTNKVSIGTDGTVAATQSGTWTVSTTPSGSAAVLSNQVAVTGSAVALASNPCRSVTVKALVANTIAVYVGPSGITTATGYELFAGDSITLGVSNTNLLYLIASTTGASISWIAVN